MADFGGADLDAFRTEARDWIAANFPAGLKGRPNPMMREERTAPSADQEAWRLAMGEKGWGAPTWPAAYGGGGLSGGEARIIQQELNKAGAYNPIGGMGVMMFGPTLLEYGTEAQKQEHIPAIVRGDVQWCQGFSEPGAGSDLASLQTKAEDKGDHFLINGQKIWTSGAQFADWCFCLVRTDTSKKHEGISFVLFTMHQPGVEVRPIKLSVATHPSARPFSPTLSPRSQTSWVRSMAAGRSPSVSCNMKGLVCLELAAEAGSLECKSPWRRSQRNMSASMTRVAFPTPTCAPGSFKT